MYQSKNELRNAYKLVRSIMLIKDVPEELKLNISKPIKRSIRDTRRYFEKHEDEECHYSEDGQSFWTKEYLDKSFTDQEKREWVEDHWVEVNSPYDCSGKWFTKAICVFNVNTSFGARSVVYYMMGRDV